VERLGFLFTGVCCQRSIENVRPFLSIKGASYRFAGANNYKPIEVRIQ
jgi:ribosomal protein S7